LLGRKLFEQFLDKTLLDGQTMDDIFFCFPYCPDANANASNAAERPRRPRLVERVSEAFASSCHRKEEQEALRVGLYILPMSSTLDDYSRGFWTRSFSRFPLSKVYSPAFARRQVRRECSSSIFRSGPQFA